MDTPPSLPGAPLGRRDALRFALLGLAALTGAGALVGCSSDQAPQADVLGAGELPGIELVASRVERGPGDAAAVGQVVEGLRVLAGGLYGGMAATPGNLGNPGNIVLSPFSILVALGMTLAGAQGGTAEEMERVLGVGDLGERWHAGVNALTARIEVLAGAKKRADGSEADLVLDSANQLFGQVGVGWEQPFLDLLAADYGTGVRAVDFDGAAEESRVLINDWVEQQTADKIVDLVPEGVIDPSTRLVLVNAIHLKAPWEQPFDAGLTAPGDFTLLDGTTVGVDLMRKPDATGVLTVGDGWRAATLPYAGRELAMTVVLPDAGLFADVEQLVVTGRLPAFAVADQPGVVLDVSLPKWSFRTAASLKDLLIALGMPTAFGDGADFTPMTDEDLDLVIADVVHQGFIAVDEEGTEAAAATAVVMAETSAPIPEVFTVGRPFLFVIHDVGLGTPLFIGRVVDPTA